MQMIQLLLPSPHPYQCHAKLNVFTVCLSMVDAVQSLGIYIVEHTIRLGEGDYHIFSPMMDRC